MRSKPPDASPQESECSEGRRVARFGLIARRVSPLDLSTLMRRAFGV